MGYILSFIIGWYARGKAVSIQRDAYRRAALHHALNGPVIDWCEPPGMCLEVQEDGSFKRV